MEVFGQRERLAAAGFEQDGGLGGEFKALSDDGECPEDGLAQEDLDLATVLFDCLWREDEGHVNAAVGFYFNYFLVHHGQPEYILALFLNQ